MNHIQQNISRFLTLLISNNSNSYTRELTIESHRSKPKWASALPNVQPREWVTSLQRPTYLTILETFSISATSSLRFLRYSSSNMAKGSNESPFVIITGDPQHRHGERISQIRSHLATKQHQKTSRSRKWRHASPKNPHLQALPSRRASPNPVPKEIRLIFESPQLPTSAIGQRRMQKCESTRGLRI